MGTRVDLDVSLETECMDVKYERNVAACSSSKLDQLRRNLRGITFIVLDHVYCVLCTIDHIEIQSRNPLIEEKPTGNGLNTCMKDK